MAADRDRVAVPAAIVRAVGFLALWIVIAGTGLAELAVGIAAAAAATWASLTLLPPRSYPVRLLPLARLMFRFPLQSIVAGADVARRALDPRLPVCPGFVSHRTTFPAGPARSAFTTWLSLVPGTLPAGSDAPGSLLVHCLDVRQPVAAGLAAEETRLQSIFARPPRNG